MAIQNVNATNNSYQVAATESQQNQQIKQPEVQNTANTSQDGDKLMISREAEKLQNDNSNKNTEIIREDEVNVNHPELAPDEEISQEANTDLTGLEQAAVPTERPDEGAGEQGVMENRSEQLRQQQQNEENVATERNTQDRNPSLDLTV